MTQELQAKVSRALELRAARLDGDVLERNKAWNEVVECFGARRIGALLAMIVDAHEGSIRVVDPLTVGSNPGYIEIPSEAAVRIATLGVP